MKLSLKRDEEGIYITKFRNLFENLLKKGSNHSIFNNKKIYLLITKYTQDTKLLFRYFKSISEYLTHNPSVMNTTMFINYVRDFTSREVYKVKNSIMK